MLRWRLGLGTVLVSALVALFWLDCRADRPGIFLVPLALLAAGLAAGEMQRLLSTATARPRAALVYCGTLLVVAAAAAPHFLGPLNVVTLTFLEPASALAWPLVAMVVVILAVLLEEVLHFSAGPIATQRAATSAALTIFAVAYAGLLLSFLVQLRFLTFQDLAPHRPYGTLALISLLVVVKMNDVGAYTVGRLFGRHKLAPRLSPGKTIEGAIGGLAFAAASSVLVLHVLAPYVVGHASSSDWWQAVLYGLLLAVAGTIGDLAESMLKREAGVKDSSTWMPGFGGVLDLLDSLLLAAPVAYLLWIVGLVAP
ncbi:MAG: phosphatidate cytidylyltransferase [Planctomycetia bacterium]|nr:phosphatidate cytidylyltransferase [Planctomycetia bacterium]